jgi:hypothetical protein
VISPLFAKRPSCPSTCLFSVLITAASLAQKSHKISRLGNSMKAPSRTRR